MQSEDLDKKIRDAADNHHPAYNEKAWSKMEELLNTHMPVEEKKRRRGFILLLLAFGLLGGGTWLYLAKPWQPTPAIVNNSSKEVPQKTGNADVPGTVIKEKIDVTDNTPGPVKAPAGSIPSETASNNNSILSNKNTLTSPEDFTIAVSAAPKTKKAKKQATVPPANSEKQIVGEMNVTADITTPSTAKKIEADKEVNKQIPDVKNSSQDKIVPTEIPTEAAPLTTTETAGKPVEKLQEENNKKSNNSSKKTKENGFAITLSAGPDISAVGTDDWGKVQPVYGVGVAYTFASRFTVRTGFFTASKIYTTKPDEYKNSYSFPNYNYLDKIDADCRVYEIPLTLSYSFGATKKHNWFASTGLSSYIMKRESYDYVYKYPNGSSYTHEATYNNENTNLFSVLSLSGGYTRKLSNTFSLSAEPYLKIPLAGVGEGSVQLNSIGVLFTISAKLKK